MDQSENPSDSALLTPRQSECMKLVERGLTSKQIARELGISPRTVDQHIGAVIDMLQVNNRMSAVKRLRELAKERTEGGDIESKSFMFDHLTANDDITLALLQPAYVTRKPKQDKKSPQFPPLGGRLNAATKRERLGWIFMIALIALMLSCFGILFIMGLIEMA